MIHISRDALTLFIYNIQIIANEKYFRLHEQTRRQVCDDVLILSH